MATSIREFSWSSLEWEEKGSIRLNDGAGHMSVWREDMISEKKKMENIYLMLSSISIVISSSLYVTFCVLQGAKSHLITIKSNSCPRSLFSHVLCLLLVFLLLFVVCGKIYFISLAFIYYEWDRVLLISYCLLFHVVVVRAFFLRLL